MSWCQRRSAKPRPVQHRRGSWPLGTMTEVGVPGSEEQPAEPLAREARSQSWPFLGCDLQSRAWPVTWEPLRASGGQ